jgi:beta-N-acetylhexosaminidase
VRRAGIAAVLALAATLAGVGIGVVNASGGSGGATSPTGSTGSTGSTAPATAQLSLAQLAGQRIIYSYSGLVPPASLLARIRAGDAAGVVFFATNVSSVRQLAAVAAQLQQASDASPVHAPLLLMTDQEGGLVRRLPRAPVLSEKQIGASANGVSLASQAGAGAGATLRQAGLNVNLAPVLDVYRTAGNFIDRYQRSYSSSPAVVASLGAAFITAQQAAGVAATAKHFPGLGSATAAQDTDLQPVTLSLSAASLRTIDEAPYVSAIRAGVQLVMLSWAAYPALGGPTPAGLSSAIIGGELRKRLAFSGVTLTDGIGAGALVRFGGFGARAVLAARAGADLILCTGPTLHSPTIGGDVLATLKTALARGTLSRAATEQAVARVIALRRSLAG